MHVAPLFDIVEILRNLHLRCHILGLIWVFVVLHADSNHCVQCLSPSAIYRSAAPPQSSFSSTTALVTPNTEPLSRDDLITTSSSYDIRFDDAFWSAVEGNEESLTFSLKSNARLAASRETFVKTATVVATVYVDGNSDEDDDDCNSFECHGDGDIDDNSLVFDKRFWLITRVGGALTEDDVPNFRQRLVELYGKAFNRQQLNHLGFTTTTSTSTTELPVITLASGDMQSNGSQQNISTDIRPTSVLKYEGLNDRTDAHRNHSTIIVLPSMNLTTIFDTENNIQPRQMRSLAHNKIVLSIRPTPVAPTQMHTSFELSGFHQSSIKRNAQDLLNHLRHEHRKRVEVTISIMIHNISVAVDDFNDAENRPESPPNNVNRNRSTTPTTTTMPSTNALNQTDIVYTVLVNGKSVLAVIAAGDMELIADTEATNELNRVVYIKAEPYLKEPPYATPLIPSATTTEFSTVFAQFLHTPNVLILIGIAMFLLTCLIMALMMLSVGSRCPQHSKSKDVVSREAQTSHIVSPVLSSRFERGDHSIDEYAEQTTATIAAPPITGPRLNTTNQLATQMTSLHGIDNFGYERDHSFILIPSPPKSSKQNMHNKKVGTPNIHFPSPPSAASTTATQSSADSLSDASSIYYIKKPKRERDRDRLTDSRPRGRVYATIVRKPSNRKATNHGKPRRKYLKSENRVGTLVEAAQVHSSHSDNQRVDGISGDDTFDESKDTNLYEHIEAINPFAGNYANQNRRQFVEKTKSDERADVMRKRGETASTTQNHIFLERNRRENDRRSKTANVKLKSTSSVKSRDFLEENPSKQRHGWLETGDNGDTSSVGSFLSMVSVRSFPKCVAPEPLTRVLNYDDNIEIAEAINRVPRIVDTKLKNDGRKTMPTKPVVDAKFSYLTRTRSDGADPGVIGPVVWQIHKKQQEVNDSLSPLRDPVSERNRYEGLLEGAMNLYTIETTELHSVETATDTATLREETQRKSIYASKLFNEK